MLNSREIFNELAGNSHQPFLSVYDGHKFTNIPYTVKVMSDLTWEIVHCATREESLLFLAKMMIEHEWYTSVQNHHPSLKKSFAPLLHNTILNKCRNRTFLYEKWMGISSCHNGRLNSISPTVAGGLTRCSKCSILHSLFYAENGLFSCTCWKNKFFSIYSCIVYTEPHMIHTTATTTTLPAPWQNFHMHQQI